MEETQKTLLARLARARVPSSIARPAAMKSSQPSRRLSPGLLSSRANILVTLLPEEPLADDLLRADGSEHARLTRRELEVLAAMADGASNKAIARRLGISFHTVKSCRCDTRKA